MKPFIIGVATAALLATATTVTLHLDNVSALALGVILGATFPSLAEHRFNRKN